MYRYTGNCPAVYLDPIGLAGIFFDGAWQQPNSATTIQDLWNRYKGPKSLFTKIDPFAYKQEIEKALQFCEAERAKNPNEPIDIFGWSRGGYYGFRLVHELSNKGIPVRFVGLIDPVSNPNPAYPLNIPSNVSTIFIALTDGETAGDTILDSTIFSDMQISQNPDWVLTASTQNFYPIGHRQSGFPSNPPGAAIRDDLRARASKCGASFVP